MRAVQNYTPGQSFKKLTLVRVMGAVNGRSHALFRCECGNEVVAPIRNVVSGDKGTCGCSGRGRPASGKVSSAKRHPFDSVEALKLIWHGIRYRCENPNATFYSKYGARGIYVCERWKDFDNFLLDMGTRPSKQHSLDRINNDGPYSPDNCRWATRVEQQNNRRCNVILTLNGESRTVPQWSREIGVDQNLLRSRVKLGWPDEKILTTPARPKSPKGSGDARARFREKMRMRRQAGSC